MNEMINKKVIYSHGHFVDKENGQRIIPRNGCEYILVGSQMDIMESDPLNKPPDKLENSEEKLKEVNFSPKSKDKPNLKLAESGQVFLFRIGLGQIEDEDQQYIFKVELNEDLYAYLGGTGNNKWRLFECYCQVTECIEGRLNMYEKIYAYSINDAFSKTVAFYFPFNRKSSANAHTEFYFWNNEPFDPYFNYFKKGQGENIKDRINKLRKNL